MIESFRLRKDSRVFRKTHTLQRNKLAARSSQLLAYRIQPIAWSLSKNRDRYRSSRKVAISWLPVLLHHRTYRSGIRRFVRIIMNMFPFAKWSSNYRSRHSPPYANIYCSAFAAVLDCGISDKVSYWCCPTYKPLIARYLSSSGWEPLFLFASIFAMSLSEGDSEPSHQAFACYS